MWNVGAMWNGVILNGVVWNMMWCEICYDVECGCGVEVVYVGWCEMWTVVV